jgi:membrane-associated phospholipid phosphatase
MEAQDSAGSHLFPLRATEKVLLAFFAYVALLSLCFPPRPLLGYQPWLVLFIAALSIFLASRITIIRELLPLLLTFVAFREMELFRPAHFSHYYEGIWVRWDHVVLSPWHGRAFIESFGPILPEFLEACYLVVYGAGLFGVIILYFRRRGRDIDRFLLFYVSGTLLAYAFFPFFPSEPPRLLFPQADPPHYFTTARSLNLWLLQVGTIHSSVFPSAHVSSAFSAAWGLFYVLSRQKRLPWIFTFYALSVAVATVYGRYHYLVDAVAGLIVSILAAALVLTFVGRHRRY